MRRTTEPAGTVRWFAALVLAGAGICCGAGLTVTVDLGPERAERLRALAEDPVEGRPTSEFTAVVTVTREAGEGEENPEDPCGPGDAKFVWGWGAGDCIAGGGEGDPFITLRCLPGQDGDTTVAVTATVKCGADSASASDSVLVVVPTWTPDLPITPGDTPAGGMPSGSALAPAAVPAAAPGDPAPAHAITVPADQDLIARGATVDLAGTAHDPKDKRLGAETTETSPVPILPAWCPPTHGTLSGGTVDAAGRRYGSGVTWCVQQGAATEEDECRTPPLPDPVGAANLPIRADFVDAAELAQPRENGTSIDPVFTDTVTVHVVDAAIAANTCCVPWDAPATVELTWVLGPPLSGLGGSGIVALTAVPSGEEALMAVPLASFTAVNGGADTGMCFWMPQHADGSTVAPGQYTFTLDWTAELAGRSATVQSSVTITVFKVEIADADDTLPAQRQVVCVGKMAAFVAKVTPAMPGEYEWSTGNPLKLTVAGDGPLATVTGEEASAELADKVALTVDFAPSSCMGVLATASHALTVADVEIRGAPAGDGPPDEAICVGQWVTYFGRQKPAGLAGTCAWPPVPGSKLAAATIPGVCAAQVAAPSDHSDHPGAETLRLLFVPAGLSEADAAEDTLSVTVVDVRIVNCADVAPSPYMGAGQTLTFRAQPLPEVGGAYAWSTASADLVLSAPTTGRAVEVTATKQPASTGPHPFGVTFSPSQASTSCVSSHAVDLLVADLDVDSDNNEGYFPIERSDAEDQIEDDSARLGKVVPANRSDGDCDGIPDFADGFDLAGLGGDYAQATSAFVVMVLEVKGLPDLAQARFRFDYDLSSPAAVSRTEAPDCSLVYRAKSDAPLSNPDFRFYSYSMPGGAMRIWKQPGSAARGVDADLINPGAWYEAAQLGIGSTMTTALFVEGVSAATASAIVCTMEYGADGDCKPKTTDQVCVSVVELDAGVNTNNDRKFALNEADDAIEDQGNGFLFWPSRDGGAEVTPLGIVDLMPARFSVPQALLTAGFRPYVAVYGPENSRVDFYRNANGSDLTAYLKDSGTGDSQVGQPRELAVASSSWAMLPMNAAVEQWLLKFPFVGGYRIAFGIENPAGTERFVGDSVKVTVRFPADLYWYGSARGAQALAFNYPVDSPSSVAILRFPDVVRIGEDNRDWTKQKHLVFLHGFNNNSSEAREWNDEIFRRLYWTGYRDNYIGITWFGDEGPDLLPGPGLEEYNFDLDVENALHTSPSVYVFLRDTVAGSWGVAPADINIMAHSLGNLVMWDALRINAHLNPGSQLVNNVLSSEAAVWPETFAEQTGLVYSAAGDDPISYTPAELIQHSWSFWFRQAGREAASSAAQVFHSYVADDSCLRWMRTGDKVKRGSLVPGGREHYFRENVDSSASDRSPGTLHNTPTLMLPEHRRLVLEQYDSEDINRPLGTQAQPLPAATSITPFPGMGWDQYEHSDLRYQAFFRIYPWYHQFLGDGAQIP